MTMRVVCVEGGAVEPQVLIDLSSWLQSRLVTFNQVLSAEECVMVAITEAPNVDHIGHRPPEVLMMMWDYWVGCDVEVELAKQVY